MNQYFTPKQHGHALLKVGAALVAAVAIAAVLLPAFVPPRPHHNPNRECVNNEKQLGIAFRGFGIDIGGFPMSVDRAAKTNAVSEVAGVESPAGVPSDTTKP